MNLNLVKLVIELVLSIVWKVFLLYLLFAVAASTVPWIFSKPVSEEAAETFSRVDFHGGNGNGPDRISLVETTGEAFSTRIQVLRRATTSLDIVCHAVQEGETTTAFLGEAVRAADRGVTVRIFLDAKTGAMGAERRDLRAMEAHPNIRVRMYNPVSPWKPWKWHALLHDKFILVDGEYLLMGGRNIGDRYFAPDSYTGKVTNDRDVLVWRVESGGEVASALDQVAEYMETLWSETENGLLKAAGNPEPVLAALRTNAGYFEQANPALYEKSLRDYLAETVPTAKITLIHNPVHTGVKEPWIGHQMTALAKSAEHTVLLQTPYATANKRLLAAMTEVAGKADAVMLTNSAASSPNIPAFSNYYTQRTKFVDTGATICEYQSGHSIHGKSMVVDGRLSAVGSYNMDDRSFYIDTETMLVVDSPEFAEILSGAIGLYRGQSLAVGGDNAYIPRDAVPEEPVSGFKKGMLYVVSIFSRLFQFLV